MADHELKTHGRRSGLRNFDLLKKLCGEEMGPAERKWGLWGLNYTNATEPGLWAPTGARMLK